MLRANSDTAVVIRLWSITRKPSDLARSRAPWRATTISSSTMIGMTIGMRCAALAALLIAPFLSREQAPQEGAPLLRRQGRVDTTQLQPQFDQGDRDRRLDTDDHRLRAEKSRA